MPETGYIDGSAPPFILLAIAFATLPLIFNFLKSSFEVAETRYRSTGKVVIFLCMLGYFVLGSCVIVRIYLNGLYNLSCTIPKKTFPFLDLVIMAGIGVCFVAAFILISWYLFYVKWLSRFSKAQATGAAAQRVTRPLGRIDWDLPGGITERRTALGWEVHGRELTSTEIDCRRQASLVIDLEPPVQRLRFRYIKRKDKPQDKEKKSQQDSSSP